MFGWILLAVIAGIWIGIQLSKIFHREMIKQILKDIGVSTQDLVRAQMHIQQQIKDESKPQEVDVTVEQHSGCYYAYHKHTDEFLGQGEDYVHLLTALQRKLGQGCTVNIDYAMARDIKGFPQIESTRVE